MGRVRLARAARLLGLPPLTLIQMTQGPNPVLTVRAPAAGHAADAMIFDEDELTELKAWLETNSKD